MIKPFVVVQKSVASAIWFAFIAVSAAPFQVDANWHTNCFTPGAAAPESIQRVLDASALRRVGQGTLKEVTPRRENSSQAVRAVTIFLQKVENSKKNNLYFRDPQTTCLAKIDLDRPLFNRRSISFKLVHESSSDCRETGLLGRVNLVEINPCEAKLCKRSDNDLFLFFGPEEIDKVTFSDVMFYGGEFEIGLSPKPWRISAKALHPVSEQRTN